MVAANIAKSLAFFILAGLCEIGGGYLVWIWLRNGKSAWYFLFGAIVLILLWNYTHPPTCKFR